jgi:hypothetical protein
MEAAAPHPGHCRGRFHADLSGFIFNVLRTQHLPELLLPTPSTTYKALA